MNWAKEISMWRDDRGRWAWRKSDCGQWSLNGHFMIRGEPPESAPVVPETSDISLLLKHPNEWPHRPVTLEPATDKTDEKGGPVWVSSDGCCYRGLYIETVVARFPETTFEVQDKFRSKENLNTLDCRLNGELVAIVMPLDPRTLKQI